MILRVLLLLCPRVSMPATTWGLRNNSEAVAPLSNSLLVISTDLFPRPVYDTSIKVKVPNLPTCLGKFYSVPLGFFPGTTGTRDSESRSVDFTLKLPSNY